jgi:hypothetical protein
LASREWESRRRRAFLLHGVARSKKLARFEAAAEFASALKNAAAFFSPAVESEQLFLRFAHFP